MKMTKRILTIGLITATVVSFIAMKFPGIMDYLSVGKQLNFNGAKYDLKWSSHPSENYYKQEYLKQGEELGSYHNMILVETIEGNLKVKDALNTKASELETRKKWDFVANYQVYENKNKPTEGIIDFVVSDTMTIYEWNLYRYQMQKGAMILFAYSYRDSLNDDNDLKKFFGHIKEKREDMINKLQSYSIPEVKISK
jgi:hypothetical protein